jgi:hypothetical protein
LNKAAELIVGGKVRAGSVILAELKNNDIEVEIKGKEKFETINFKKEKVAVR